MNTVAILDLLTQFTLSNIKINYINFLQNLHKKSDNTGDDFRKLPWWSLQNHVKKSGAFVIETYYQ